MYQDIIDFCFKEVGTQKFFEKDNEFDELLTRRFGSTLERAAKAELYTWRAHPEGRLAEIIVLDQFSRNIYRDTAKAFAQDTMALVLAQEAVAAGLLQQLESMEARHFLLMPYMHSESKLIHEQAEQLFKQYTNEEVYGFEIRHKVIIDRFGRYPHRNEILGRQSTAEEIEFLTQPGSSF
ncbi:DUF924 family protein [Psychrobacter phenylpyruvicus]|uniref:Uncharacterized protein conserved in bacteria n=1 Tax=Psychrobacter phenylpyruvicus TaxID=29432 RepID=A0A379LIU6_9GAMM|nr:DUF924 family protein [Psychrobacter phenylpyruvicus]SUD90520.1 Uncharacterized protein conserved in bacteria [Psychrobacter phenylpyruvicus]